MTISTMPPGHSQVLVEGLYGAPMIDVQSAHFKCFLIVAGGLGWNFLCAWKHQLASEAARGRPLKVVHAVAVLKHWNAFHAPLFSGWPDKREGYSSSHNNEGVALMQRKVRPQSFGSIWIE
jgi:hypothetical protein